MDARLFAGLIDRSDKHGGDGRSDGTKYRPNDYDQAADGHLRDGGGTSLADGLGTRDAYLSLRDLREVRDAAPERSAQQGESDH